MDWLRSAVSSVAEIHEEHVELKNDHLESDAYSHPEIITKEALLITCGILVAYLLWKALGAFGDVLEFLRRAVFFSIRVFLWVVSIVLLINFFASPDLAKKFNVVSSGVLAQVMHHMGTPMRILYTTSVYLLDKIGEAVEEARNKQ